MEPILSIVSRPSGCEYLPDRISQMRYDLYQQLTPDEYASQLRAGWRRFGAIVFQPQCPSCRMCQSLRVIVDGFQPNTSQRRAWKRNAGDVTIRVGAPSFSAEKLDLLARFHRHGHETKRWPAQEDVSLKLFVDNPFPTEEWCYYVGGRLVGVGYVDALPNALSAIYFYWDPAEHRRSLGTFNILALIAAARERGLPHVYLGYYVEGCRSLEYKAKFAPNEVLRPEVGWESTNLRNGAGAR